MNNYDVKDKNGSRCTIVAERVIIVPNYGIEFYVGEDVVATFHEPISMKYYRPTFPFKGTEG